MNKLLILLVGLLLINSALALELDPSSTVSELDGVYSLGYNIYDSLVINNPGYEPKEICEWFDYDLVSSVNKVDNWITGMSINEVTCAKGTPDLNKNLLLTTCQETPEFTHVSLDADYSGDVTFYVDACDNNFKLIDDSNELAIGLSDGYRVKAILGENGFVNDIAVNTRLAEKTRENKLLFMEDYDVIAHYYDFNGDVKDLVTGEDLFYVEGFMVVGIEGTANTGLFFDGGYIPVSGDYSFMAKTVGEQVDNFFIDDGEWHKYSFKNNLLYIDGIYYGYVSYNELGKDFVGIIDELKIY